MKPDVDSIVIGAGHNALVCAANLARSGQRVLVLEAASHEGGALRTRAFAPGYSVSACAHLLHHLPQALVQSLDLSRHGLRLAAESMPSIALGPQGAHIVLHEGEAAGVDGEDAAAYRAFHARMQPFAARLFALLSRAPPNIAAATREDQWGLLHLGWQIRSLGRTRMRDLLRIVGMNVHDLATECFTSEALRAAIAFDAVLGIDAGPRTPGTVLTYLTRLALTHAAGKRGTAQVAGGMGALGAALANAARAAGAEIRLATPVARILVEGERACGVTLVSGEMISARRVISSASPRQTFLRLLGAAHLDAGFTRQASQIRARGHAAKLHLALSACPDFPGLSAAQLAARLIIAPSLRTLEHAYNGIKYGELPETPVMEISIPTIRDPSLAPPGGHVLSAIVQFVPDTDARLPPGWRDAFVKHLIATIAHYAPGLAALVHQAELLMPQDIAGEFGLDGGHWHQGELAMDQFYFTRPLPGAAQYATPLPGLFLCGAGSHPGGGIAGLAGDNAARHILRHDR